MELLCATIVVDALPAVSVDNLGTGAFSATLGASARNVVEAAETSRARIGGGTGCQTEERVQSANDYCQPDSSLSAALSC